MDRFKFVVLKPPDMEEIKDDIFMGNKYMRYNLFILFVALCSLFVLTTCEQEPNSPEYDNIFDPDNPQTGGDPFQLRVIVGNGGIILSWKAILDKNLLRYEIYRSEYETSGYVNIGNVVKSETVYVDKTVENGHNYWYRVTARDKKGNETETSQTAPVSINTEPILLINGGEEFTASLQVQLTILANTATEMMLSNIKSFAGAKWETYASEKTWHLESGEGSKSVHLKIRYEIGQESEPVKRTIIMDKQPPVIGIAVTPDSGITGETNFLFDLSGSRDSRVTTDSLFIRFDWENDAVLDTDWLALDLISHIYSDGGDKTIHIELSDGFWEKDTLISLYVNTRPQGAFTWNQVYINRIIHLDASGSIDAEDGINLTYRWDFDNDGIWDTPFLTANTVLYEYPDYGTYTVRLEVRDSRNLTGSVTTPIEIIQLMEMILVDGGTFTMGDTWGGGFSDQLPTHTVTLNSFSLSKYEVTQAEYQTVMGSNPSNFSGDSLPVENVTWYDAVAFCNTLSEQEGLTPCYVFDGTSTTCDFTANGYRLPTEAEWEYAARGGNLSQGFKYSGSRTVDEVAWYSSNSGSQTHDVGTKLPNELGLYDMSGNVREWCWDWYGAYTADAQTNPTGPASGTSRILRGGGWYYDSFYVRVAHRSIYYPPSDISVFGFRISRTY